MTHFLKRLAAPACFLFSGFSSHAQMPDGRELLAEMRQVARSTRTLTYKADILIVRGSELKDSVFRASSFVQAGVEPNDKLFGAYFQVKLSTGSANSEFCYDGQNAISVQHGHADPGKAKKVSFIEARRISRDAAEWTEPAQGFIRELLLPESLLAGAQASPVKVLDGDANWILQWEQTDAARDYIGLWQLQVKKNTLRLVSSSLRSTVAGRTYTRKVTIKDLQADQVAVPLACPDAASFGYEVVR